MAKTLTKEIRPLDPSLTEICKLIDRLAHRNRYDHVFQLLLDKVMIEHFMPGPVPGPQMYREDVDEKDRELMDVLVRELIMYYHSHSGLRTSTFTVNDWVDPLGDIYMAITGTWKSQALGQFFTPQCVVNMMAMMITGDDNPNHVYKLLDPAAGSGRTMMASAYRLMEQKVPSYACCADLDPICCKMCIVNMVLNGVVGEVICMNSLTGPRSHDWAMQVMPLKYVVDGLDDLDKFAFYFGMMKENMQFDKYHYVAVPMPPSATYVYHSFTAMQAEREARQAQEMQRLHDEHRKRLVEQAKKDALGTLFHDNSGELAITEKQTPKPRAAKPRKTGGDGSAAQSTLF